jgi:hypothetical protein
MQMDEGSVADLKWLQQIFLNIIYKNRYRFSKYISIIVKVFDMK